MTQDQKKYHQIRLEMTKIYEDVDKIWGKRVPGCSFKLSDFNAALSFAGYFDLKAELERMMDEQINSVD